MHSSLQLVLILLAVAVLVAAAARALRLPTMLGYLVTGIAIGPFALGWIPDSEGARYLAEFFKSSRYRPMWFSKTCPACSSGMRRVPPAALKCPPPSRSAAMERTSRSP